MCIYVAHFKIKLRSYPICIILIPFNIPQNFSMLTIFNYANFISKIKYKYLNLHFFDEVI